MAGGMKDHGRRDAWMAEGMLRWQEGCKTMAGGMQDRCRRDAGPLQEGGGGLNGAAWLCCCEEPVRVCFGAVNAVRV